MPERILNVHTENWSEEPFAISRGVDDNFDVVVVELEQNGCKGWGEATPTEHYNESISQTKTLVEDFRSKLENGMTRSELQQAMPKGAARNAVDCALWDLDAKLAGKRVWEFSELSQHLRTDTQTEPKNVTTVYSLGVDTPEKMGAVAQKNAHRPLLKLNSLGMVTWNDWKQSGKMLRNHVWWLTRMRLGLRNIINATFRNFSSLELK